MTTAPGSATPPPWRVAVTRDEGTDGPLTRALEAERFAPVACPVLVEAPPADAAALAGAAARLDDYDWIVCASARAVRALAAARAHPWPPQVRTAAVGARTAAALRRHGASPPLVGDDAGADALWTQLRTADAWPGRRVLVATTPGGRRTLIEALTTAGAEVDAVETYRMEARPAAAIAADWAAAAPEAAVVASPRVAEALVGRPWRHGVRRPARRRRHRRHDRPGADASPGWRMSSPTRPTFAPRRGRWPPCGWPEAPR